MIHSITRGLAFASCLVLLGLVAVWQQTTTEDSPRVDLKPFAHWSFTEPQANTKQLPDRLGVLHGSITGKPVWRDKPASHLLFQGPDDGVVIHNAVTPASSFLPKEAFTIVAWVRIDDPTEWGGFLSCMQDNGPAEKGLILGYNKTHFQFGLATKGADDGDGSITYLKGNTPYELHRWYHIAGVYDGKEMRLYVNGQPDGASREQSGAVLYAEKAPLVLGRYRDDDEDYPLTGALREVLWCDRAIPQAELQAHFVMDQALAAQPPAKVGPKFVIEPYLQFGTRTSMVILCETDVPTTCRIEYGEATPGKLEAKVEKAAPFHEVPLSGLTPKTKYLYRVHCTDADGNTLSSKWLTFMTAPDAGDAWSFAVIGDTQRNPEVTAQVTKLMWERRPHFVLHNGDTVNDGDQKWQWEKDLFGPGKELFSRVAMYPTIGNHEKNHAYYYQYFSLPKPEYYYSFRYGNAEFFSIDTNTIRTASIQPGGEQYQWLDRALAASDATWKVCFHHHPVYSSDSDDFGDTWKGRSQEGDLRTRALGALYEKHNVDIVFNGHIHLYERSWPVRGGKVDPTGVTHITSGGGGGRLEDFGPTPTWFKAECRVDYHFCYLTVHQKTLNFKAFDHEGRLFDTFSRTKE